MGSRCYDLANSLCLGQPQHDLDAWFSHLTDRHGVRSAERCPFCSLFVPQKSLSLHIRKSHFQNTPDRILCPVCTRRDGTSVPLEDYDSWLVHAHRVGHSAEPPAEASKASMKRKFEESVSPESRDAPPKSQRGGYGDLQLSSQSPGRLAAAYKAPSNTLDLSLIDPVILSPAPLDPALQKGDISTGSLLSLQSLDGSTACASPVTDPFETDAYTNQSEASPPTELSGLGSAVIATESFACPSHSGNHVATLNSEACTPCQTTNDDSTGGLSQAVLSSNPEAAEHSDADKQHVVQTPGFCPFYSSTFTPKGLFTHIRRCPFGTGPVACPVCVPGEHSPVVVKDYKAWRIHAVAAHRPTGSGVEPTAASGLTVSVERKMEEIVYDMSLHRRPLLISNGPGDSGDVH